MVILLNAALLALLAVMPAGAETIFLKTGEEVDAVSIVPGIRALRVVAGFSEREIPKKDLTPEQVARYYGSAGGVYLSLETRKVAGNTEYSYFRNGKLTGRRVFSPDNEPLRTEGYAVDGVYKEYYPGDRVQKEVSMAAGKLNGPFRRYYEDGSLQCETWYVDDRMHGLRREFDPEGGLVAEEKYVRGRVARPGANQADAGRRRKT